MSSDGAMTRTRAEEERGRGRARLVASRVVQVQGAGWWWLGVQAHRPTAPAAPPRAAALFKRALFGKDTGHANANNDYNELNINPPTLCQHRPVVPFSQSLFF